MLKKLMGAVVIVLAIATAGCKEKSNPPKNPTEVAELAPAPIVGLSKWVNDSAKVLSTATEVKLRIKLSSFSKSDARRPQIVVLTVPSLAGRTIEEYATETFRKTRIGDASYNSGILIVVAVAERKIRIEVGYGLEGAVPDIATAEIIRTQMIPNLKRGSENWEQAILLAIDALIDRIKKDS